MNPRRPYRPGRKKGAGRSAWPLLALGAVGALAALLVWSSGAASIDTGLTPTDTRIGAPMTALPTTSSTPTVSAPTLTPDPTTTRIPNATPASEATPTLADVTPAANPTLFYTTLSGDTLPALAARFGVLPEDIVAPNGLVGTTTLAEGQLLVIPHRDLGDRASDARMIPDSELIYTGSAAGFDAEQFATEQGGYLAGYSLFADGLNRAGGDVVLLVGQHHSINPRLLVALLEYNSGWVTGPNPTGEALAYPMGYVHPYKQHLYTQMYWAAAQLSTGYYGWRAGTLTHIKFLDGASLRLDPTLNAGTVALLYYFAQIHPRTQWENDLGPTGFIATYQNFFGDPFTRTMDSLIPVDLTQPPLTLPFLRGHTWYFSGGPHGAWLHGGGGAMAALDFAPGSLEGGCAESLEWVTAVAAGKIVRVDNGSVLLDLDGDGREATGWVILYLHIAEKDRIAAGAFVEAGDRLGHPSCEGGTSTGTHVHIARKYNGEWIPADGVVPFDMSGWIAHNGAAEYLGTLTRNGVTIVACTCTAAWTGITADP